MSCKRLCLFRRNLKIAFPRLKRKKKSSSVYEKLPIHNKRRSQRFQINEWSRAFSKTKLVNNLCGWVSAVGLLVGMKFHFQISSPRWIQGFSSSAHKGYCRTYPKNVFLPIVFAVLQQQDKIRQHLGWNWNNYYWLGNCLLPIISFRIFSRALVASTQSCIFFRKKEAPGNRRNTPFYSLSGLEKN